MKIALLSIICGLTILSCRNDDDELLRNAEISFALLHQKGNEKNTFKEGEDILFKLEIKSHSPKKLYLSTVSPLDTRL